MLVSKLIEALQKLPQDMEVWVFVNDEHAVGEPIGNPEIGFVTDLRCKGSVGTLWPDLFAYDDIEEDKRKVVVVS